MKKVILNLLIISSVLFMMNSCNKNDIDSSDPDYTKDKGEFKDSRDGRT